MEEASNEFLSHLNRLRANDSEAIDQFVAMYEPYIRRSIRIRINRSSLQPVADSVDICNSVMGSFLLRLACGEYELATELDLRRLLLAIANNKFLMLQRREFAAKRDRSITRSLTDLQELPNREQSAPSFRLEQRELLSEVSRRLDSEELELFQLRSRGISWSAISQQTSESVVVLRKRLSRGIQRVSRELGLDDLES